MKCRRTWRPRRHDSPLHLPNSHYKCNSCPSSKLSKNLVLLALCLAFFHVPPRGVVASSASSPHPTGRTIPSSLPLWQEESTTTVNNSIFSGGSASSDDNDELEDSSEDDDLVNDERVDVVEAPESANNEQQNAMNHEDRGSENDNQDIGTVMSFPVTEEQDESETDSEQEEKDTENKWQNEDASDATAAQEDADESDKPSSVVEGEDKHGVETLVSSPVLAGEQDHSESESEQEEEETDDEWQNEDASDATAEIEAESIQDQKVESSSVVDDEEVIVSDGEAEWFDSDDGSTDSSIAGVTVDVTTVKEEHANINLPHQEPNDDEPVPLDEATEESSKPLAPTQPLSAMQESASKANEDTEEAAIQKDGHDSIQDDKADKSSKLTAPAEETIGVEESESESDEEEGSVAASEVDSEGETSDWSEDERSVSDSDEENDFVEESVAHSSKRPALTATSVQPEPLPPVASNARPTRKNAHVAPKAASAATVPGRRKGRTSGSSRRYGSPNDLDPSSQPLKTLEKLQNMLDETDYMTARGDGMRRDSPVVRTNQESMVFGHETMTGDDRQKHESPLAPQRDPNVGKDQKNEGEKLWTSKDRMKYKKQQQRIRRAKQEQKRLQEQLRSPPLHPNSSDDEDTDDTDDGLGYTLPNLPVFFSDAEGTTTDLTDTDHPSALHQGGQMQPPLQPPPPPPFEQRGTYQYPPPPGYYPHNVPDQNMGQPMPPYYPPNPYGPYGSYGPYNQQQMAAQYAAWAAASAGVPPYGAGRPPYRRPYTPQASSFSAALIEPKKPDDVQTTTKLDDVKSAVTQPKEESQSGTVASSVEVEQPYPDASAFQMSTAYHPAPVTNVGPSSSLAEASSHLTFDSVQKISVLTIGIALLCYSAVSPRSLPPVEYNAKFYENIKIVSLMMIAPILSFLLVFDPKENDINNDVNAFYIAFAVGYGVAFLLQVIFTTVIRLGVFSWLEPDVFQLTPQVPSLVLPWVLRENRYRPKRITLFAADFATSCVACPIIEEYVKLKILQWSARLPRNFKWTTKASSKNKKKKRRKAEAIPRYPGNLEVTNINPYVSQMLAVALGIKLCDSTRRILMYTKDADVNKGFYALCRGIFPIQELCGTMTALALAKRDVLGWEMPLWKMLAPAVVIHGMANFRGMKPIFKWNSATPWSEMQLLPWNAADDSTLPQLMNKGFAKLMWLVILGRVLGYCIKNYYLIRRQAVKRTTTYAGKRAAFSAELAATEMLKKTAKDK